MAFYPISVVLPTHNRAHLFPRAIDSVLSQLENGDELIVVDDGSTDNTHSVISNYGSRIRYIKTPGVGAGAARNIGIREAQNPLLAFIDSDDEWLPGKVQIQRSFLAARPDVVFCFTNFSFKEADHLGGTYKHFNLVSWSKDHRPWEEILAPGEFISTVISLPEGWQDFKFYVGNMYVNELSANYINVNTLMLCRQKNGDTLYFAEDTPTYEDWEFFGRLSREGNCAYLDCETACQHSHGGPRLTDAHITECAQARVTIIERVWGKDKEFLAKYYNVYKEILDRERLILTKGLIARGHPSQARRHLNQIYGPVPILLKLLSYIPGKLILKILRVRRYLKPLFNNR